MQLVTINQEPIVKKVNLQLRIFATDEIGETPSSAYFVNATPSPIKKLLIEAPPAGVRLRKQFCYSRNYNINVVISYIIKKQFVVILILLQTVFYFSEIVNSTVPSSDTDEL